MAKIIFSVHTYWPQIDGVQKVTAYQAEGLAKLGHSVTVITSDRGTLNKQEEYNGVMIRRVPAYKFGGGVKGNRKIVNQVVEEEIESADIWICVCPFEAINQWILPVVANSTVKKIGIMHGMHDFKLSFADRSGAKSYIKKKIRNIWWRYIYHTNWKYIQKFDRITHLHEKDNSYKFFEDKNYRNNVVLYNAVDPIFFERKGEEKKNRIINVSTFFMRKNQKLALDAFFEANLPDWELVLIGPKATDYYEELLQYHNMLVEMNGVRNVQILCNISREETVKMIKESKIYLLTSTWEAFPVSVIEAMASGASFVATDVGVVKYWPGGIVCQEEKEIRSTLKKLAEDWETYGNAGRQYAIENFQYETLLKKLESVLLDCEKPM